MKRTIKLNESELRRMINESVKKVLNEAYGVDFEDTLRWVQNKKPDMSPQEQEKFARNIISKKKRDNTIVMDGEYESVTNPDADMWWILHVYYGLHKTKEKHYTVYSEEEATKIYNEWMKWALKIQKEKGIGFWKLCHIEAYEVENPSHSDNRDDWYYSNWSPGENI
jgi:hypothetical protein